jgi:large subunit ribosomal protein L29
MKASEMRAKDIAALEKEVGELLTQHFKLRMQRATQQLGDHSQLGKVRRDVARAKTVIAQKKRAAAQGNA